MQSLLLIIISASFIFGQLGRIQLNDAVAVTPLDVLLAIVAIYWLQKRIREKKIASLQKTPLWKPFIAFFGICIFSLLINSTHLTFHESFVAFLYLLRYILYSMVYFIVFLSSQSTKKIIKRYMLIAGGGIVLLGYLQLLLYPNLRNLYYLGWDEHNYRLFSTFLDPNFAGVFFALFFIFLCGLALQVRMKQDNRSFWFLTSFAMVTFFALFLTQSRSAILAVLTGSFVLLTCIGKRKLIFGVIALLLLLFLFSSRYFYLENINPFRITSSIARVTSAEHALMIINDHPIFGVGFNAYAPAQRAYGFTRSNHMYPSHADAGTDTSILFVLATTGVVGLAVYSWMWVSICNNS